MAAIQSVTSNAVQRVSGEFARQSGVWQRTPAANDSAPASAVRPGVLGPKDRTKTKLNPVRDGARRRGAESLDTVCRRVGVGHRQIAEALGVESTQVSEVARSTGNLSFGELAELPSHVSVQTMIDLWIDRWTKDLEALRFEVGAEDARSQLLALIRGALELGKLTAR